MTHTEAMDWWLQRTAVYGLAFVFTAAVLLILVYVAVSVVRQFNKWLPAWFEASIAKQHRDSETLERIERCMERQEECTVLLVESSTSVRHGLRDAIIAARRALSKKETRDHLNVGSDVLADLDTAAGSLGDRRQRERYERRKRELEEGKAAHESSSDDLFPPGSAAT